MWLRRCRTTSATKETNSAVVVTPLTINIVANVRSQVGWFTKLKSP